MRPPARLLGPLEAPSLQLSKSLYVCSTCRQEFLPRAASLQFRRNASENLPFTERVRRKIWGTDNPPGLKDPYGGEGAIERALRKRREAKGLVEEEPQPSPEVQEEIAPPADYKHAETWDGLENMGHLGRWYELSPTEADEYNGFMARRKLTEKGHIYLAAHQTAVELCMMQALNKPLTAVCQVLEHDKSVFKMMWKCKIQLGEDKGKLDTALVFPNKDAKDALFYVFQQIGNPPEPEATAEESSAAEEATEQTEVDEEELEEEEIVPESVTKPSNPLPFFGYRDTRDDGFLSISLNDPATKFAFLKRLSQLTGHYFPDPVIHSIKTVKQAVEYIQRVVNPPPKKLAPQLAANQALKSLPNVKIYLKRRRPSDIDEELGRKKVIEAELRARGLID
ncbi:ribosomal subunit 39S-domain-containing protein [Thermoascus aurantiacus ATCC 26904]